MFTKDDLLYFPVNMSAEYDLLYFPVNMSAEDDLLYFPVNMSAEDDLLYLPHKSPSGCNVVFHGSTLFILNFE